MQVSKIHTDTLYLNTLKHSYAAKYQQYRQAIKSIREREEKLSDVREKKRSLQSRIANLTKSNPKSPKLAEFQKELKSFEHDTLESELDLAKFKRFALKEAFYLRFNAMHAFAEKTAIVAGFAKYLVDLIEIDQSKYDQGPQAAVIIADALNALENWAPAAEDERVTALDNRRKGKEPSVDVPHTPASSSEIELVNTPPSAPPVPEVPHSPEPEVTEPPALPPRTTPTGYSPQEVQQVTSDVKTQHENEIDLERIDLYDAPPPAYEPPQSSPLNADRPGSFYSPYQHHTTVPQTAAYSPSPSSSKPSPYLHHQPSPYQGHASPYYGTPLQAHASPRPSHVQAQASFTAESPYTLDYHQLYRQASFRHQQHQPHYRPYEEFQQRFVMDAGGFRVPPPLTAEEEKNRLAQHYERQSKIMDEGAFMGSNKESVEEEEEANKEK
jgi:hypothetical protein